jgi:hypothetical protein
MMHKIFILAAIILMTALPPLQVTAACKEKLAEVDQRMASPQMDVNQRNAVQMFRDQAAGMCDQGHDASAMQTLGIIEMMLPPSQAQQAQAAADKDADGLTKARLTNEFLAGTWCSMSGEERVQLVFSADGTYQPCFPSSATQSYGQCIASKSTAEWLNGFERDDSSDQDQMSLGSRRRPGSMVYKRGECKVHGR